jgi:hypothetical protein
MSYQMIATGTETVRNSDSVIARFADRVGTFALLVMGLALGGVTAFIGL